MVRKVGSIGVSGRVELLYPLQGHFDPQGH